MIMTVTTVATILVNMMQWKKLIFYKNGCGCKTGPNNLLCCECVPQDAVKECRNNMLALENKEKDLVSGIFTVKTVPKCFEVGKICERKL